MIFAHGGWAVVVPRWRGPHSQLEASRRDGRDILASKAAPSSPACPGRCDSPATAYPVPHDTPEGQFRHRRETRPAQHAAGTAWLVAEKPPSAVLTDTRGGKKIFVCHILVPDHKICNLSHLISISQREFLSIQYLM